MYDYLPYLLFGLILLLGLIMVLAPVAVTKREQRDIVEVIKKTRRNGFYLILTGIVLFFINLLS